MGEWVHGHGRILMLRPAIPGDDPMCMIAHRMYRMMLDPVIYAICGGSCGSSGSLAACLRTDA